MEPWLIQLFAPSSFLIASSGEAQKLGAGSCLKWHFQKTSTDYGDYYEDACFTKVKEGRQRKDSEQATFHEK